MFLYLFIFAFMNLIVLSFQRKLSSAFKPPFPVQNKTLIKPPTYLPHPSLSPSTQKTDCTVHKNLIKYKNAASLTSEDDEC
ncbi:hypothetical protein ERO13_D06G190633v2 [Gossypium hirsutum]|uniref:Secreted protein n=2 Tax=Gossypium TaxID=3633 RepID=A0A0D2UH89_GOSRA|nr:hypothetical protein ERO13_D06G190633v2 [Gossypium hirsutum]KJB68069.1 hypothetical protein B456_010G223700 [Gossypium raimondii]TYI78661.1 hypothetical protein E1A91_D06G228200v1 [Gossypium mustelinum]